MKLINNRYSFKMDFDITNNYLFVIENAKEYRRVCFELFDEFNGVQNSDFVLSENANILAMTKNMLLFCDYFSLDINNKKNINEINNRIQEQLQTYDFAEKMCQINKLILEINDEILDNFDFKITYDEEFGTDKLIKISNYRISESNDFLEKIIAYIKIYSSLKPIKFVIFIGLMQFLTKDEIQTLAKNIEYLGLGLLLVERNDCKLENFKRILIDNDLCEI